MRTQFQWQSRIAFIKFTCLIELGWKAPVDNVDWTSCFRFINLRRSTSTIATVLQAVTFDFFDRDLVWCPMPQVDEEKAAFSGICSLALDREPSYESYARMHALTRARTRRRKITYTFILGWSTRTRYERMEHVGTRCVGH